MHTSTIDIPQEKIEQFKKDAYFILESVIPDEHLELLREVCQAAIEETDAEMDRQNTDVMGINQRGEPGALPRGPGLRRTSRRNAC